MTESKSTHSAAGPVRAPSAERSKTDPPWVPIAARGVHRLQAFTRAAPHGMKVACNKAYPWRSSSHLGPSQLAAFFVAGTLAAGKPFA
jgi:hypothetical protein